MMKTKPVQRKKQLKKQKIELSPETQTPLEQIELVTDKTNDVKRTLRQVQKQVAKARGANKGTKMATELTAKMRQLMECTDVKPQQLKIELPMVDKVDLTGLANLEKAVVNLTKEAISSSRAENDENASLLGKMASVEESFNEKLATVKHVNGACDDANGQISAMLDKSDVMDHSNIKIDVDQLIFDVKNETDEIDRLFEQFDMGDYVAKSSDQVRALAAANQQKLVDFDAESDQLLMSKNDEISFKLDQNQQLKHDIGSVVGELTDLRRQCAILETTIGDDKNETSRVNDDIDYVMNNIALLNDNNAAEQAVIDDLMEKRGQSHRETVSTEEELRSTLAEQTTKSDDLEKAKSMQRQLQSEMNRIEDENENNAEELSKTKKTMRKTNAKIDELRNEIVESRRDLERIENDAEGRMTTYNESLRRENELKENIETMKNEMKAAETREAELIELINQMRRNMKKRGLHAELLEFYKANAELDEQFKRASAQMNARANEEQTSQWEVLYAKQNDMLEQSCQLEAENTALDCKIRENEVEFERMEGEEASLVTLDEKLAKLSEEDAMLDADLCRNDSTQKASYMNVANDAKCRLEATKAKMSLVNKLTQKSTGFKKTQNLIEETRAEVDQLTQKKMKIDKVKELKEQISWCKDANDN